jgi:thiosulfate reductase cytochrome b subunit
VQILTGFLLTLPFTDRFRHLDDVQRGAYLGVLCGSVVATGLIIAPVAFHRVLFRHGQRPWLVEAANQAARAGLFALALTTSGMVWLVFDLVTDRPWAGVAGIVSLLFFGTLWGVVPWRGPRSEDPVG